MPETTRTAVRSARWIGAAALPAAAAQATARRRVRGPCRPHLRGDRLGRRGRAGFLTGPVIATDVADGLFPGEVDDAGTDLAGGLVAGWSVQRPGSPLVAGIEADVTLSDLDRTLDFSAIDPEIFVGGETNSTYTTEIDVLSTLRLRAGHALGDTLLHATGGLAGGRVANDFSIGVPFIGFETASFREEEWV